ncbi:fasciclin domain-containing protein [Salmonirosea aquatica]|uniref:Fasciclin domain-containing protein n=1 Tax=Salmonirosea aquatica TaxID=2654236 RepID=A0A7C9F681_9BACT|nr:fasciclin domain-containing protein [Cytophagaceae bacterium SJW1-29]
MKKASEWTRSIMRVGMAVLLAGCIGACTDNTSPRPASQTVVDVLSGNSDFSILKDAVEYAGLTRDLRLNTVTVFAPTNAAFQASGFADAAAVKALPASTVKSLLQYHMIGFNVPSSQLVVGKNEAVTTLQGGNVYVTKLDANSGVSVNNARVTKADMQAQNGLIHVIDRVLMVPTQNLLEIAQADPNLTYLVAAATRAAASNPAVVSALTSTKNVYTVFAPTNEAFIAAGFPTLASIQSAPAATLAGIVLNHVIADRAFSPTLVKGEANTASGGKLAVDVSNGVTVTSKGNAQASKVVKADILATNGVIHIIDRVLLP